MTVSQMTSPLDQNFTYAGDGEHKKAHTTETAHRGIGYSVFKRIQAGIGKTGLCPRHGISEASSVNSGRSMLEPKCTP